MLDSTPKKEKIFVPTKLAENQYDILDLKNKDFPEVSEDTPPQSQTETRKKMPALKRKKSQAARKKETKTRFTEPRGCGGECTKCCSEDGVSKDAALWEQLMAMAG